MNFEDIDPQDLIDFATRWTELSSVVRKQVKSVLNDINVEDVSENAIRHAADALCEYPSVAGPLIEWLDKNTR